MTDLEKNKNRIVSLKTSIRKIHSKAIAYFNILKIGTYFLLKAIKVKYLKYFVTLLLFSFFILLNAYLVIYKQSQILSYFSSDEMLSNLRSLFLTLGGALIGATAIAFTLIMFAMQVNVERMPYALFRKFSQDPKIIWYFVTTFLIALIITSFSLIPDESWVFVGIICSIWGTFIIIQLFFIAFRRALNLINPVEQLKSVVKVAEKSMTQWGKISNKVAPIYYRIDNQENDENSVDLSKVKFFQSFKNWTYWADQSITHSISFAKRYAEQGDYDVTTAALDSVVKINKFYIEAKGKTFFNNTGLLETTLSTDYFIINTLEHLRKIAKTGVSLGDEQFIEEIFRTFAKLVEVYASIDYGKTFEIKSHAQLANNYLFTAVKSVVPHGMTDVLMEGSRLMGKSANILLNIDKPESIISTINNLSAIAYTGTINDDYMPVTIVAMEQLSLLTYNLILSTKHDIGFAAKEIRNAVNLVVDQVLNIPDTQRGYKHHNYLSPYFSQTNPQSLINLLKKLANSIVDTDTDNESAKTVINNIEKWADGSYSDAKDILLLSIKKRSFFTFDIICWITTLTNIFLVVSNSSSCDEFAQKHIQKHAKWLISQLSWIPKDDNDSVSHVEGIGSLTENLFEASLNGYKYKCPEISIDMQKILLDWGFKAGRHRNGWAILERSIYSLASLSIITKSPNSVILKKQIKAILRNPDTPDKEIKDRTAREIRYEASNLNKYHHSTTTYDFDMKKIDPKKMKSLLIEIADLISPDTSDEPIPTRPY